MLRLVDGQGGEEPIVERAMDFEFECAKRVSDAFDGVFQAMRPVIHRINAPGVASPVVRHMQYSIQHWVTHVDIGGGHVDFGSQNPGAVGKFPGSHACEQVEVFLYGAVSVRAFLAGFGQGAAGGGDFLGSLVVDISQAFFDHHDRIVVHLLKVIRGIAHFAIPFKAEPADIFLDGLDVFDVFLAGVGVVHAQVAFPVVVAGDAEVDIEGLGMADMEIAVGFRREAGADVAHAVLAGKNVGIDDFSDEVGRLWQGGGRVGRKFWHKGSSRDGLASGVGAGWTRQL